MKNKISKLLTMNVGIFMLSVGVYFFKIPNGFSTGGVSGIGTIFGNIFPIFSATQWILLINIVLLAVGFVFLGKQNGIKTVYCSVMYSLLARVFEIVFPLSQPLTREPLMELCYAMLLTGIGSAFIFNAEASSGGTDIIALILKKYTKLDVGKALLCTDFVIAIGSFFVFGVEVGLFSLLGLFAKAFLIDVIIDNLNSYKYFVVITEKPTEIKNYIMLTLHHGVTSNRAIGEFTSSEKIMIHTVCKRIEAIKLKANIKNIDPHAFIIVTTTSEIIGRGFRSV